MHFAVTLWALATLIAKSLSDDTTPMAIVVPASEYFEGNDGPWSTFDIRVGTPEQDIRVLVSTASPFSMVALSEYGCSTSVFATVPSDCAVSRGNLFNRNTSSTWQNTGSYGINQNGVGLEANLGYTQRAELGLDHLAIGLTGPGLDNQTIAGIATPEPFYLGIFGINNQPVNYSTLGNSTSSSFLTTLKDENKIPSLSWSYTAGAQYRLKQVYGQLIFSGYDTSRFKENSVSFTMADDLTRDLVVALQSISYSGSSSMTLLSESIDIFIDSTDPNIWLPGDACDAFEMAFGLTLDSTTGLYLVNETQHNTLLNSDAQVTFRVSDVKKGGDAAVITLPYAAFDLTAEYPLVDNSSHYFPLKRANSSKQYTLGRTFLQEAYLSVDYERKVFNVSACVWNQGATANVITIPAKDSGSATGGSSSSSKSSRLAGGALAGVVVGCVVAGVLIAMAIAFVILRKRRKWIRKGYSVAAVKPERDNSIIQGPVFNSSPRFMEDGSTPMSAADISAPRSTAGNSSSAADSPPRSDRVGENIASAFSTQPGNRDTHIGASTELDGKPLPMGADATSPVAKNPDVYELQGSEVAGEKNRKPGSDGAPSVARNSVLYNKREGGHDHPSPTLVSPQDTLGRPDERADFENVSPVSPVRHRA